MKRFKLNIVRNSGTEVTGFRAVNIGSLEGMARDMIKEDRSIRYIQIDDTMGNIITVR